VILVPLLAVLTTLPAPAVNIPIDGALVHSGAVLDAAARARIPHVSTMAVDHDGHAGEYQGVRIGDVLRDAGAPVADGLRGPAARTYVLVSAKDGYSAVFALGELETSEARCAPLLADARDRSPLPPHVGPVQVVAPCDRTHARWVRAVTELTIVVAGTSAPAASER